MTKYYLLDTNIVSEAIKDNPNKEVMINFEAKTHLSCISTITWAELILGTIKLPDGKRKRKLENFYYDYVNGTFEQLPFDEHAANIYPKLLYQYEKRGGNLPDHDLQMASIAIANNMILVTRNTKDFESIPGLMLENWFAE